MTNTKDNFLNRVQCAQSWFMRQWHCKLLSVFDRQGWT